MRNSDIKMKKEIHHKWVDYCLVSGYELSKDELDRYSRQIAIPNWGLDGQRKLKAAKVAIIGVGGLGSFSSMSLVAAGVGWVKIIDKQRYELSNLNRQILGWQIDVGKHKAEVAKEKLTKLNPNVNIEAEIKEITEDNIIDAIHGLDVVVDGMDNWKTRFIINDACVRERIPFVHAGVSGFWGQITTIVPGKGPCLRCVFAKSPKQPQIIPIFGATPALLASLQAMEALKLILGLGKPLIGRLLFLDGENMECNIFDIVRKKDCPVCGSISF